MNIRLINPVFMKNIDCLILIVKYEEDSCMLWGAIYSCGFKLLVDLMELIPSDHYQSILADHLHPMLQTLSQRKFCAPR